MRNVLFIAVASTLLVACNQPAPPPAATTAPVAVAPVAAPVATPAPAAAAAIPLWFEPAGLRTCDKTPQAVTVFWDARGLPSKGAIELKVVGAKGKESSFAVVGRVGKKDTGAWMVPGSAIVMRSQADGSELARARIKPLACD
jgi:hypothetical protein